MIEPLLTTVAKRLHNISPDREISPQQTQTLLEQIFKAGVVPWDNIIDVLKTLPEDADHALCEWVRQTL